jgi:uncharacterized repeat protein (TIGR03837 family)
LVVTPGRPLAAMQKALKSMPVQPNWSALPYTDQEGFDEMLWACDLNFVRGEDSLVRALWAGRPFIWQIYPQDDNAHHAKLEAFLEWLQAPESVRNAHRTWNGTESPEQFNIGEFSWPQWADCCQLALNSLKAQKDLCSQIVNFSGQP